MTQYIEIHNLYCNIKNLAEPAKKSLSEIFIKLDAQNKFSDQWIFPEYVSKEIVETIIKNTCFKCGGSMKPSKAFMNEIVSFNDFGNDAGQRGTTQSPVGKPELINVNKCSLCGHSYKT